MRILITILVTLAVLVGAGFAASGYVKSHGMFGFGKPPEQTYVRIEPVKVGTLTEIVTAPGVVEPKTKVSISARVVARIVELPYEEGMAVTKGGPTTQPSVLVKLDDKDLQARLRAAQARYDSRQAEIEVARARVESQSAQLIAARATLNNAERDFNRQRKLLETHDVAPSVMDTAQARYDELKAQYEAAVHSLAADRANIKSMENQLKAAKADVEQAEQDVSYAVITSPIDGVVTKLNVEVGELVVTGTMNNAGTVLMEVADLNHMRLVARVDETSIAGVKVGQRAKIRIHAYADEEFDGVVETVGLASTSEGGNNQRQMSMSADQAKFYEAKIHIQTNGRRILSGLNGDAEIETERHENVVKVPSQAVLGRPVDGLPKEVRDLPEVDKEKTYATVVYRYVNGKAVITPVKVGPSDLTHTVIVSGLKENDPVIVGPYKVLESIQHDQVVNDERNAPTTQPAAKGGTAVAAG